MTGSKNDVHVNSSMNSKGTTNISAKHGRVQQTFTSRVSEADESPMNIKNPLQPDGEQQDFSTNKHVKLADFGNSG